jgi:hypothetical protein
VSVTLLPFLGSVALACSWVVNFASIGHGLHSVGPTREYLDKGIDPVDQQMLRLDWTRLAPLSPLSRLIQQHQSNCSLPAAKFWFRNRFGLGSDLHVYSQAICNSMVDTTKTQFSDALHPSLRGPVSRIRTIGRWNWYDEDGCGQLSSSNLSFGVHVPSRTVSPMTCYFTSAESSCIDDEKHFKEDWHAQSSRNMVKNRGTITSYCDQDVLRKLNVTKSDFRAAVTEFLFTRVSPLVYREAHRQLRLLLSPNALSPISHPETESQYLQSAYPHLVTVHIRWGDKANETRLVPIQEYVGAVKRLVSSRISAQQSSSVESLGLAGQPESYSADKEDVRIFLATEDPQAVREFMEAKPSHWTVYVDRFYTELSASSRVDAYNGANHMALKLRGKPGLVALASLLVAAEANDYVLTTSSNWSRLINEIRQNIVNPRCGDCTRVIDLQPGEW